MNTAAAETPRHTPPDTPPHIELDGQRLPLPPGLSLADLLDRQGLAATAVATAVNQRFVPRAARCSTLLQAGDCVTTFEPITGG
jgi:sulfur carrier protein